MPKKVTTAQWRKRARKAEDKLQWSLAAHCWDRAIKNYPRKTKSEFEKVDIASLRSNRQSCLAMVHKKKR